MKNKIFCVLSHTHWDREWYAPFEQFRLRLCDLINNLFKILEKYPNYIFHLDAQTIVLRDYLEIYPENREKLSSYIKSGNIIVGPWYVQNDFFLSSGEATVRNLIIGKEIANDFGKCADIGYTPDQFGLCSQLPQIFSEFGIKYHLFGRGYSFYEKVNGKIKPKKTEINFIWCSPDGSKVTSTLMPFWYNNAQRLSSNIQKAVSTVQNAKRLFEDRTESPFIILMNGVDHLEAQDDLLPIIEEVNKHIGEDEIIQCSMEYALEANAPYAKSTVSGELRYGAEYNILTGTLSTRTDIKKLNFDAQNAIEHKLEPLYSMINLMGADIYPQNQIKYLWEKLIPNHAHDSICCCSNGNVMKHMKDRYLSIGEVTDELLRRGCRFINHHLQRNEKDGSYYLTVINTNQTDYHGIIECELNIMPCDSIGGIKIYSPEGKEPEFVILSRENAVFSTFSPLNLPGCVDVVRYKIRLECENIPAFGYVNYTVRMSSEENTNAANGAMENEYIGVDFEGDTVNMLDKKSGIRYKNVLKFEDIGDDGDVYTFKSVKDSRACSAKLEKIETLYSDTLKTAVKLSYSFNYGNIEAILSLGKHEQTLNVDVSIENNGGHHLLRAVIDTGIDDTVSYSSSVFDIIRRDSGDIDLNIRTNGCQPNNGFVYKKSEGRGLAVYTKGIYEYENTENTMIKLSLLRSVDMIAAGVSDPIAWGVSDNLMIGKTKLSFAIMPFDGDDSAIAAKEQNVNYQPLYYFDSVDTKAFSGGRVAVQDGDVGELYYPGDEFEALSLPHSMSLIKTGGGICVTALKKAEKTDGIILRAYNPWEEAKDEVFSFDFGGEITRTNLSEKEYAAFDNTVSGKKIITLLLNK